MADAGSARGAIITFYSYKGGVGRSMALANAACLLTERCAPGQRILAVDWDMEAPGLHRFFGDKAGRPDDPDQPGLIEYFMRLSNVLESASDLQRRLNGSDAWTALDRAVPIQEFVIADVVPGVDLLKAGILNGRYPALISGFNWVDFYQRHGRALIAFREMLAAKYTYCLIDSRTGFTDIGGICTMLLPEKLVTVFTPNLQSLSGVLDLAERAVEYRRSSDDLRPLAVFPLASRIELAEKELRDEWRKTYQRRFEDRFRRIYGEEGCDLSAYFDEVQLPHVSYYAYGEKVAVREERSEALSLRRAYEVFCERLIDLDYAWQSPLKDEEEAITDVARRVPAAERIEGAAQGFVPGFEHDVFISYAAIDNEPYGEEQTPWVSTLFKNLDTRLQQILGSAVTLWLGNRSLPELVPAQLERSAILISVVSPRYVASDDCMADVESFTRAAERTGGIEVGGRTRIFKLMKRPVELDDEPLVLRDLFGYDFYRTDPVTGRVREYHFDRNPEALRLYWASLDDLAQDVGSLLADMRRRRTGDAEGAAHVQAVAVYLAQTTRALQPERRQLLRELKAHGYRVLPDRPLPTDADDLKRALKTDLDQSHVSIHLVGDNYGLIPDGEVFSVVELQHRMAAERAERGDFVEMIWMPPDLEVTDPRQQNFIGQLEHDAAAGRAIELHTTTIEKLKTSVQHRLRARPKPSPRIDAHGQPAHVYLLCDGQEADAARALKHYLIAQGFEVTLPLWRGDATQMREDHEQNLRICDAALIYYGKASEIWFRAVLRDLVKVAGLGRASKPLPAAIYLAPPRTSEKEEFESRQYHVIRAFDGSVGGVAPFLAELVQSRGANPA